MTVSSALPLGVRSRSGQSRRRISCASRTLAGGTGGIGCLDDRPRNAVLMKCAPTVSESMDLRYSTNRAQEPPLPRGVHGGWLRGMPVGDSVASERFGDVRRCRTTLGRAWSRQCVWEAQETGLSATRIVQVVTWTLLSQFSMSPGHCNDVSCCVWFPEHYTVFCRRLGTSKSVVFDI